MEGAGVIDERYVGKAQGGYTVRARHKRWPDGPGPPKARFGPPNFRKLALLVARSGQ